MAPEWIVKLSDSFYESAHQVSVDFRVIFGAAMYLFLLFFAGSFVFWILYTLFSFIKKKVLAFWEKKRNVYQKLDG